MTTHTNTNAHLQRAMPKPLRASGLQPIEDSFRPCSTVLKGSRNNEKVYSDLYARASVERVLLPRGPVRNSTQRSNYDGAELRPFTGRPGAMDAFEHPSRVGGRVFYRDGRVEVVA